MEPISPPLYSSDSTEQREAEAEILAAASRVLVCELVPGTIQLSPGVALNVDGVDRARRVLCEVYARIGRAKGSQPAKLAKDALKLVTAQRALGGEWRKVLCFADAETARCVTSSKSWLSSAVRHLGVEVQVFSLSDALRKRVVEAQHRQRMVNPS